MKRTVFLVCLLLTLAMAAAAQNQAAVVAPADMKWVAFPNFPDCVRGAVLHGDPSSPSGVVLQAKGPAGCKIPWHWHTANEQLGMVSGSAKLEMKDGGAKTLTAGAYGYLPAKHVHQFACTTACTFFVASDGPFDIHYVNAAGTEISPEQALGAKKAPAKAAPKGGAKK